MARIADTPVLTPSNRIYLYRLLSQELGCGKQTFLPAVEEALASDRMTADDLGFESTRALLEALDEFIKLTVFKGGRIYATVIAQPVWDEALAALESGKAAKADAGSKSNKPWKRKKTDKTLKPVRPKRVKRPEPQSEPETKIEPEAQNTLEPQERTETPVKAENVTPHDKASRASASAIALEDPAPTGDDTGSVASTQSLRNTTIFEVESAQDTTAAANSAENPNTVLVSSLERADDQSGKTAEVSEPAPAISLTVTYDPYSGIDREVKLESHPAIAKGGTVEPEAASAPATPQTVPGPDASPAIPVSVAPAPVAPAPAAPASVAPVHAEPETSIPSAATAPAPAPNGQATAVAEATPPAPNSVSSDAAPTPKSDSIYTASEVAPAAPIPAPESSLIPREPNATSPSSAPEHIPLPLEILATYPTDFAAEVYPPSDAIAELCELLPYGTEVFTLLAEDYERARELELVSGTRARATFPLRIQHVDSVEPIRVTLKKRSGSGLKWELCAIE